MWVYGRMWVYAWSTAACGSMPGLLPHVATLLPDAACGYATA